MPSDDTASALSHFRDVMGDIGDSYIPDSVERAEMIGHVMVAAGELHIRVLHEWRCPSCGATTRARMADAGAAKTAEMLGYLLAQYDRLVGVHAHIRMDTDEDRALHAEAVEVFRAAVEPVRAQLAQWQTLAAGSDPAANPPDGER